MQVYIFGIDCMPTIPIYTLVICIIFPLKMDLTFDSLDLMYPRLRFHLKKKTKRQIHFLGGISSFQYVLIFAKMKCVARW